MIGLIDWMEFHNRADHRDLGRRIDKVNTRIDDLHKLLLQRLPPRKPVAED